MKENDGSETYENLVHQLTITNLQRQLLGSHQRNNMALAITAFLEVIKTFERTLDEQKIQLGIKNAVLAGRFEQVLPGVYFDGAHNPASTEALVQTIGEHFPTKRIEFFIGFLADKDVKTILRSLEEVGDAFYFANIQNDRAMQAQTIYELSHAKEKQVVSDMMSLLQSPVEENTIRIVTGSLYLLSEIRQKMK